MAVFYPGFFFFFSFSKNVTIKIPKIKSLLGPPPLVPQPPPPKRGPVGGGGGKEEKKKREKNPLFCFLFSQEAQESLRQWRRWSGGDGGGGRQGEQQGGGAGAQVGPPADPHPPGAGSWGGSSPDVPVQALHALLAA